MKVIVFAHRLEIGGTQVNAIDLATRLRDHHDIEPVLFATPGPALTIARERGLRFEPAPDARFHPSMRRINALRSLVRREAAELVHAWDWWQGLEAYYGVQLPSGIPMVVTDMMMDLTSMLPRSIPITFGTPEVLDKARQRGYRRASLLVPPVDTNANAPGVVDATDFRRRLGLGYDDVVAVTVSRLAHDLKGESLRRTISAIGRLGNETLLKLVIVGGGEARTVLEEHAQRINKSLSRNAVIFAGEMADPRSAYEAADIVVGMGGSSLRGAAFGKPVVVVGENGFSSPLSASTADWFFYHGMYGHGIGDPNDEQLTMHLQHLALSREARLTGGDFGRRFVEERFSLSYIGGLLAQCYRDAVSDRGCTRNLRELMRTTAIYLRERRFLSPSRGPISVSTDSARRIHERGGRHA